MYRFLGSEMPVKKIVVGGDPRVSSRFIRPLVKSTLLASGSDVADIGIAPTPTVEIAVKKLQAAGGIAITASHNPMEWNGIKFIGADGMFLPEREVFALYQEAEQRKRTYASWEKLGKEEFYDEAVNDHLKLIYDLPYLKIDQIRQKKIQSGIGYREWGGRSHHSASAE